VSSGSSPTSSKEDRDARGDLEASEASLQRFGESAPFVPEQLRGDQRGRFRRTPQGDGFAVPFLEDQTLPAETLRFVEGNRLEEESEPCYAKSGSTVPARRSTGTALRKGVRRCTREFSSVPHSPASHTKRCACWPTSPSA